MCIYFKEEEESTSMINYFRILECEYYIVLRLLKFSNVISGSSSKNIPFGFPGSSPAVIRKFSTHLF